MTTREHLIQSLRTLCAMHGGFKAVADKAGVDDQSLYQIISGVKLPSGNAKGVGPTIQRKLDTAFPGWADMPGASNSDEAGIYRGAWPFRTVRPASLRDVSPEQLAAIEQILAAALSGMTPNNGWTTIARAVAAAIDHKLATDPDYELGPAPFTKFVSEIESAASKVQAATQAAAKVN
jgi:hypothetical protein